MKTMIFKECYGMGEMKIIETLQDAYDAVLLGGSGCELIYWTKLNEKGSSVQHLGFMERDLFGAVYANSLHNPTLDGIPTWDHFKRDHYAKLEYKRQGIGRLKSSIIISRERQSKTHTHWEISKNRWGDTGIVITNEEVMEFLHSINNKELAYEIFKR